MLTNNFSQRSNTNDPIIFSITFNFTSGLSNIVRGREGIIIFAQGRFIEEPPTKTDTEEISGLMAVDIRQGVLWTKGELQEEPTIERRDLPIHFKNEDLIVAFEHEIQLMDPKTGKVKISVEAPFWPLDSIIPTNWGIIVKNRYQQIWAYDNSLNLLWDWEGKIGHFPFPFDIDNDEIDEIIVGWACLAKNGSIIWDLELNDNADGIVADNSGIYIAGGDEKAMGVELNGTLRWVTDIGHAQTCALIDGELWMLNASTGHHVLFNLNKEDGSIKFMNNTIQKRLILPFFPIPKTADDGGEYGWLALRLLAPWDGDNRQIELITLKSGIKLIKRDIILSEPKFLETFYGALIAFSTSPIDIKVKEFSSEYQISYALNPFYSLALLIYFLKSKRKKCL